MIAEAKSFELPSQSLVFYKNITVEDSMLYGDCANCGEKQVHMFDHMCENPKDADFVASAIIDAAHEKDQRKDSTRFWLCFVFITIFSLLIWMWLYG